MTESKKVPVRSTELRDRATWQRPEVRRVQAGDAETITDSTSDDVVFS